MNAATHRCYISVVCFAFLFLFSAVSPSHAQRYHVNTYSENDGLPSSLVKDITQDHRGRMWFATRSGVARYDGLEWTNYDASDGLTTMDQDRIICDGNGRIWTLTSAHNMTVLFFEDDRWHEIPRNNLTSGRNPTIAAVRVIPYNNKSLLTIASVYSGIFYLDGIEWKELSPAKFFDGIRINGIEWMDDRLFVATTDGLLVLSVDFSTGSFAVLQNIQDEEIKAVAADRRSGTVWIVGYRWISTFEDGGLHYFVKNPGPRSLATFHHMVCEPDGTGGLYFGNTVDLYQLTADRTITYLDRKNGLISNGVESLYLDREHNMWVANLRGLSNITGRRFSSYDKEHGLCDNEVTAILERRGEMVLGHPGGITFLGDSVRTMVFPGYKINSRILDMAADASDNLWVAADRRGLLRIDRDNIGVWYGPDAGLDIPITSVLIDRNNQLWVTSSKAMYFEENNHFVPIDLSQAVNSEYHYIRRLFNGKGGLIYVATRHMGVCIVSDGRLQRQLFVGNHVDDNVYALLEGADGALWVGTYTGLFREDAGELVRAEAPGPVIDKPVYFIVEDPEGNLWFGTDNGVRRWNGEKLSSYTVENGLIGRETNRAAGFLDSNNDLWIGTDLGVSVYRKRYDLPENVAPLVELLSLETSGDIYPLDRDLTLRHEQNTVVFRFRAVSFVGEKNIRFRSWLEGFESEWLTPYRSPTREIRYTNLSPGEYRFHLQATSYEKPWSETVSSGVIAISGPLWSQTWFYLVVAGSIGLVIFLVTAFVSQRRYARRLENEVQGRVEEIRLMEKEVLKTQKLEVLGVFAGGIAHDFNNLLTVVLTNLSMFGSSDTTDDTQKTKINKAIAAIYRARSLTRQLLTFSHGGSPVREAGSITSVIEESASFVLSGANVRCHFDLQDDLWTVELDAGQISQVVNNLLLNAKEAMPNGGTINIRGRNTEHPPESLPAGRYVLIEVEDHGTGIPQELLDRIFDPYFSTKDEGSGLGLATAYSIIDKHDGLLKVDSEPGTGSVFSFYLPATTKVVETEQTGRIDKPLPGSRILIMDDDKSIRSTIGSVLTQYDMDVEYAADGEQAVEIYRENMKNGSCFDAVLVDLTIPGGMGGKEAIKHLLSIDPDVKAIVASGYSNDDVLANYSDYGFCDYIAKPFSSDDLFQVLNRTLRPKS